MISQFETNFLKDHLEEHFWWLFFILYITTPNKFEITGL